MLDLKQAGTLVAQLQQADRPVHPVDADLPIRLEAARREVETAFASFERPAAMAAAIQPITAMSVLLSVRSLPAGKPVHHGPKA